MKKLDGFGYSSRYADDDSASTAMCWDLRSRERNATNVYLERTGHCSCFSGVNFKRMAGRRFGYAGSVNGHYGSP